MNHHDAVRVTVNLGGVGWFGQEGFWWHVAGGARCLCGHSLCHLGRGDVEDLCDSEIRNLAIHAGCQEYVVG